MAQRKNPFRLQLSFVVLVALVLISGLLLGLSTGGFIVDFKQTGFTALSSVQNAVYSAGIAVTDVFSSIRRLANLRQEYEQLSEKLQEYELVKLNNAEIVAENQRLKDLLDLSESYAKRNIPAFVIGRDPTNMYSAITINKGAKHGIKKNMPVIAFQNDMVGLAGKVIEVGMYTSMFMPVYDFQFNVSARIANTRDVGLVSGLGSDNNNLTLKFIRKRVFNQINFGDVVVTSGENENYERDIPIGKIVKFEPHDYDASLEIELTPIINFSRLDTVIVVDLERQREE